MDMENLQNEHDKGLVDWIDSTFETIGVDLITADDILDLRMASTLMTTVTTSPITTATQNGP